MSTLNEIVIGTMQQMLSETIQQDSLYEITDYPVTGITNAQMLQALTPEYNKFYHAGDAFVCLDDGTYTKGYTYKFTGTAWELVTNTNSSGIVTLVAANWTGNTYNLDVRVLSSFGAIFLAPSTSQDQQKISDASLFVQPFLHNNIITITAKTAPISDIELDFFVVKNTSIGSGPIAFLCMLYVPATQPPISGQVTDENGNPVTDENGDPVTAD